MTMIRVRELFIHVCAWVVARLIYRVRVTGAVNIPLNGPAICVCNHVSFIDWLILFASIPRSVGFVMDHSFFKGYLLKKLMLQAKVIPIASAKENVDLYHSAFDKMAAQLREGGVICIFPEGKITYDGEIGEFRPGILKLLKTTPVPVIPIALSGLWGSLFSRHDTSLFKKRPRKLWAKIYVDIAEPIAPEDVTLDKLYSAVKSLRRFR